MPRLRPAHAAVPFLISALLAGCGGGGGGGGGGATPPAVTPALTFAPATVTGTVSAGNSLTTNVIASVVRPSDFANATTVFASVVDNNGVLLPNVQLVRDSDTQYHAVLQTAPTLAAGSYQNSFSVRLCRDSACASQFPGSPVALPYNITVTPAGSATFSAVPAMPLSATGQQGGAAPSSVDVAISAAGRSWNAVSGASWLKLGTASGSGDARLTVSYDVSGLAQGNYSTTLTISANDGQSAVLPVALTVLPPGLVLGSNSVTFTAINGAPIPSQIVSLDTDNKITTAWTARSNAGWLSVSPTAGSTPATTVLTVDPTIGTLASNVYTGAITITPTGMAERTLPVTLDLRRASLQASTQTMTLGGVYGRDFSSSQNWTLTLNTSTNSWPWQLSSLPDWATVNTAAGTVNQAGASTTFKAKPDQAAVGVSSRLVTAVTKVNGDSVQADLVLAINKDQHKLLPSETAVAFVSTPGWVRLTRTITVSDNFNNFAGMSATSDAAWLVVGVSADKLILTADPSQLLNDTLSTATITIKPSDPDASAPEVIRVALWNGSETPKTASQTALTYTNLVTDPARPYAYVHNGGAYIDVYNVYTGRKEASITGFSAGLGDMAVTPNGDALYVVDINNSRITTVDLGTRLISAQLPLAVAGTRATRLKLVRPNGVAMMLLSDGQAYLTGNNTSSTRLTGLPLTTGGTLATSADGKRVVQQSENASSIQHTTVTLDYSALNNGTLYAARLPAASHGSPGTLGQDVWVSSDGKRIYSASSTPKSCTIMSGDDLGIQGYMAIGDATPNNIEVAIDGRIFCAGAAKATSNDIYMYDSAGSKVLQQYKLSSSGKQLLARQLAISGDGWVLAGITEDGVLNFLPIGP